MNDDILDLIKGGPGNHRIVARRATRVFDDSDRFVVKAKPPAGYTPIPGGKKGGYRKRKGAGWTYWYADKQGSDKKTAHHKKQADYHEKQSEHHAEESLDAGERGRYKVSDAKRYNSDIHYIAHLAHRAKSGAKLDAIQKRALKDAKNVGWPVDRPDHLSEIVRAHTRKAQPFAPMDLVKAGKPPAGWHPIPGGKQGGYTNGKTGRMRRYWYPHDADPEAAARHHKMEANRIQQRHRGRMTASGYPKDKAAKKELEHHWHAHYAANEGDYRVGAAPKKKKPAPKKRAPAKKRQSKKPAAEAPKKRTKAAISAELRAAKDGHVVYGVDSKGKKVVYATKTGSRWKDADGLSVTAVTLQSMIRQRDDSPKTRLEIGSKRGRIKQSSSKTSKVPAKKRQSKKPAESKVHKVSATSASRYRSGGETITEFLVDDPSEPGGKRFHKYEGRGKTPAARKKHALEQHGKTHGIEKPIRHTADPSGERKAAEKKRGVGTAKDRKKEAASGKHRIAVGRGKHEEVDTHHAHGLYALHETTTENEKKMAKLKGRRVKRTFGLTHTPTGMSVRHGSLTEMKKLARHMHSYAGDAGKDATFGKMPDQVSTAKMQAGFNRFYADKRK